MKGSFYVGAYWEDRPQTLGEYIAASKRFLARLRAFHPVFLNLMSWGKTLDSGVALLPDLSNLDELLFHRAPDEDCLFLPSAPDGSPTLNSTCTIGFITSYATGQDGKSTSVSIAAGAASPLLNNSVVIKLPAGSALAEYGTLKQLLKVTVESWAPQTALVSSNAFNRALNGMNLKLPIVGWMTWVADTAARDVLPAGIQSEQLAGGLLVTTTPELLSPESPDHVATARKLRDTLQEHGFLK